MNSAKALIQPEECALLLIDQQAGLAFGVASIDRQVILNNAIALATRRETYDGSRPASVHAGNRYRNWQAQQRRDRSWVRGRHS